MLLDSCSMRSKHWNIDCKTTARLKSSATAATPVVGYRVFKEVDLRELQEEEGRWRQLSRFSRTNPASFGRTGSDRLATLLQNPQSVFSYSQTSGLRLHGLDRRKLLSSYAPPSLGKAGDRTARTATSKVRFAPTSASPKNYPKHLG